ncbi:MAG: nucleotidyltransferase family protein [Chitinophagaceae bacterium]
MKAMILAAGFGTRLKPFTDAHPKALALVNGKSLLQKNIEYLQKFGIKNVIVNAHHFANQIVDAIKKNNGWGSDIIISDETDAILETGGGLKRAAWFFKDVENFVLLNVDVLTDLRLDKMINFHLQEKPLATLATTGRKSSRYFLFDQNDNLCGWKNIKTGEEKPYPRPLSKGAGSLISKAFSGIHVINSKIFSLINQQEKFSMVDVYLDLAKNRTIKSFDHSASKFIDVGKPESILMAEKMFR